MHTLARKRPVSGHAHKQHRQVVTLHLNSSPCKGGMPHHATHRITGCQLDVQRGVRRDVQWMRTRMRTGSCDRWYPSGVSEWSSVESTACTSTSTFMAWTCRVVRTRACRVHESARIRINNTHTHTQTETYIHLLRIPTEPLAYTYMYDYAIIATHVPSAFVHRCH